MLITVENLKISQFSESSQRGLFYHSKKSFNVQQTESLILNDITCSFAQGINLIFGPNGSGKSVLLRVLAGLLTPESGRILLNNELAQPMKLRENIGYLPQEFGVYADFSVREMLHYIAMLKGIKDKLKRTAHVSSILNKTGLLKFADIKTGYLSRGMRQKIGIAQALINNPPILILDEPTASLAPEERDKLQRLLIEIGNEHTVIWVSSLLTDSYGVDSIFILSRGKICFWGSPNELINPTALEKPFTLTIHYSQEDYVKLIEKGYKAILSSGLNE